MDLFTPEDKFVISAGAAGQAPALANAREVLQTCDVVGYLFSASWCAPCQRFKPVLLKFYEEMKVNGKSFEIVEISQDADEEEMAQQMRSFPWPFLPRSHRLNSALRKRFGVQAVPMLVITKHNGTVITDQGRAQVIQGNALSVYQTWSYV